MKVIDPKSMLIGVLITLLAFSTLGLRPNTDELGHLVVRSLTIEDDRGVFVQVLGDVGDPQGQLTAGNASAAGDAEPLVLFRGAGVQDNQFVPALYPLVQLGGVDLGYVVYYFHLLAEHLADNVAPPLGGEILGGPLVDAAVQYRNIAVAHALQSFGGQSCPASVVVADNYMATLYRHCGRHLGFQVPAGNQAGVDDVGAVILTRLSHIDQRKLVVTL